jgi:hypothetical protein
MRNSNDKKNMPGKKGLTRPGNVLSIFVFLAVIIWKFELIDIDTSNHVSYEISAESTGLNTQEEFASALNGYKLNDTALARALADTGIDVMKFKDSVVMDFAFVDRNGTFEGLIVEFSSVLKTSEVEPAYNYIFEDIRQYLLAKQNAGNKE